MSTLWVLTLFEWLCNMHSACSVPILTISGLWTWCKTHIWQCLTCENLVSYCTTGRSVHLTYYRQMSVFDVPVIFCEAFCPRQPAFDPAHPTEVCHQSQRLTPRHRGALDQKHREQAAPSGRSDNTGVQRTCRLNYVYAGFTFGQRIAVLNTE